MINYNHKYLGYEGEYSVKYDELRDHYRRICSMSDEEFITNLSEIAHLACIISWFKNIPSYVCICDEGIIHELIHLIHLGEEYKYKLAKIRLQFKTELELA